MNYIIMNERVKNLLLYRVFLLFIINFLMSVTFFGYFLWSILYSIIISIFLCLFDVHYLRHLRKKSKEDKLENKKFKDMEIKTYKNKEEKILNVVPDDYLFV